MAIFIHAADDIFAMLTVFSRCEGVQMIGYNNTTKKSNLQSRFRYKGPITGQVFADANDDWLRKQDGCHSRLFLRS